MDGTSPVPSPRKPQATRRGLSCRDKDPTGRQNPSTQQPDSACGVWMPSFSISALCPAAVSLLPAALGPFPSLHRNESSLLSSPAGEGGGRQSGSLTWHHAAQAPGASILLPGPWEAPRPAQAQGEHCMRVCAMLHACYGGRMRGKEHGWHP